MCDCLPKCCVSIVYIYHVNKFEARLLFLYLPLKNIHIYKPNQAIRVAKLCILLFFLGFFLLKNTWMLRSCDLEH